MSKTPTPVGFPQARSGYQRSSVDSFVRESTAQLDRLTRANAEQSEQIRALGHSLTEANGELARLSSASVDERTRDLLDAATSRAAELVADAERTAQERLAAAQRQVEVIEERGRQEIAWRRRQLNAERAELAQQRSTMRSQLASFRALAVDATRLPDPRSSGAGVSEQHF